MRKGVKFIRGIIVSALAAAFIVSAVPANTITAKAATKVDISETTQVLTKKGKVGYKETGNKTVTITPGVFAKNVLTVTINDQDAKVKNIKCAKKLKYKMTYKAYDDENSKVIYRFSFYTKQAPKKLFKFSFTVDGEPYSVYVNATTPINKATFANQELSTKYGLGTANSVTDLRKGKLKIDMANNYALESIQIGKYRNTTVNKAVEPVLYWETVKNNKKITLSNERQVIESSDKNIVEHSMYSTTIIRVNYKYLKNNTTGSVDYYLNRIVDVDN